MRDMVGVDMGWLTREGRHLTARAKIPEKKRSAARTSRRFYTALVLHEVIQEVCLLPVSLTWVAGLSYHKALPLCVL